MAFLVACLSARDRSRLNTCLSWLSLLLVCQSVVFLVAVLFSLVKHSFLLHDLIISLFDDVYIDLAFLGVLQFAIAIVSWKHNRNVLLQPTNHAAGRTHRVCCALLALCCVAAVFCVPELSRMLAAVEDEVAPRYQHGISRYMDSHSWQTAVDRIQQRLECCGATAHSDWYTYSWMPLSLLPADPTLYAKVAQPDGQVLVPVVPTSCCRPRSTNSSCGHRAWLEAVNKSASWEDVQPADPSLLFTGGCVPAITHLYARDVFFFKILILFGSFIQVVMIVGSRYLYSSTMNSLLLGRPAGKAPGWLFGRLPGTSKKRKTLEEYDEGCGDETMQLIENSKKQKRRWKCFTKKEGKSDNESNFEDTESSRTGTKLFRSPCLAKLRKKCKKRQKSGHTSEQDSKPETYQSDEDKVDEMNLKIAPDQRTVQYHVQIDDNPKSGHVIQRKLSRNLMDVEHEITVINNRPTTQLFKAGVKHDSPFIAREIMNQIKTDNTKNNLNLKKNPSLKTIQRETENQETRHTPDQEDENEFQKTRNIFENSIIGGSPSKSEFKTKSKNRTDYRYPVNLIDFEEPPVGRLSFVKTSTTAVNSPESDEDAPVILRNYRIPPEA